MKNIVSLLVILLLISIGCKINKPVAEAAKVIQPSSEEANVPLPPAVEAEVNYSSQETWLLGYFKRNQLTWQPHVKWFMAGYDNYTPGTESLNTLLGSVKDDLSIKIVMGSWCPDSRREVPRFMRIMDLWQFPAEKITFIGVDNAKISPVGEYMSLNIERVATFIIYKKNIEIGRIIENPVTSLEQDIVNILNSKE